MKGLLFHSKVFFTYEVEFLLSCWLRQCWSIWHVNILYCSFLFRKDWLILNQTKCSFTNKIFDEQMCTQAKYMSLTVSIKFINGKIWVFTPFASDYASYLIQIKHSNHWKEERKKTCLVIDGFKVLMLKLQWKEHECRHYNSFSSCSSFFL